MGNRHSRTATRSGDHGQTSIGAGTRVDKDSPPIETLGAIDELNAWIGVLVALSSSERVRGALSLVQHDLFDLGGQIISPGTPLLSEAHVARIEENLVQMNAELGRPEGAILPGGASSSAFGHLARAICRRAERQLFHLIEIERVTGLCRPNVDVEPPENYGLSYLNRLSDLLFATSRLENVAGGRVDVSWEQGKSLSGRITA